MSLLTPSSGIRAAERSAVLPVRRPSNPFVALWESNKGLVLLIAVVAILVDFLRVLPLTISNLIVGDIQPAGLALKIGFADFVLALFLLLVRPTLTSGLAIVAGFLAGIVLQAVTKCPALSGWLAICLPWLIVNRKEFALSRYERRLCWTVLPILFVGYGGLVLSGHVVDPAMQGKTSIGWFYGISNDLPQIGQAVQVRVSWHGLPLPMTRRMVGVEGRSAVLVSDNLDLGENQSRDEAIRVPVADLRPITWAVSPRRVMRFFAAAGRLENWKDLRFTRDCLLDGPNELFIARASKSFSLWQGKTLLVADCVGVKPAWLGNDVGFYRDDSYCIISSHTLKARKIRDGASVVGFCRKPGSARVWEGKAVFLFAEKAWAVQGRIAKVCPEIAQPESVRASFNGHVYKLLGAEFHPEWDYAVFEGGTTLLSISGLEGTAPDQEIHLALVK